MIRPEVYFNIPLPSNRSNWNRTYEFHEDVVWQIVMFPRAYSICTQRVSQDRGLIDAWIKRIGTLKISSSYNVNLRAALLRMQDGRCSN